MNYENNIHYNFIDQFRPMDLLHTSPDELYSANYEPLQREAFTDLYSMITRSDYETIESKQFSIQGHIMKQGLLLQKIIQEKVQSVDLLLKKLVTVSHFNQMHVVMIRTIIRFTILILQMICFS